MSKVLGWNRFQRGFRIFVDTFKNWGRFDVNVTHNFEIALLIIPYFIQRLVLL